MKKILGSIALIIVVLIVVLLGVASTKPDSFRVERSAMMKASPEKIAAIVSDFHQWSAWSPWEKLDPAMQRTYGGAPSGTGATYAWTGNSKVGAGQMQILESSSAKVGIKLDFLKPFAGHDTATFTLQPRGDSTNVTWAMYGPSPFIHKVMGTLFNMDKMVGKDFDTGLHSLKEIAER